MLGIIVAFILLILGVICFVYFQNKYYDKISFKETLELTELPIVTFHHIDTQGNDIKLNFLLDTGANRSIINEGHLEKCDHRDLQAGNSLSGLDGIERMVCNTEIVLVYNKKLYKEVFQVSDMSTIFDRIKEETGATIHGILGNSFFNAYKYVIDFDTLVAYSKKGIL